MASGEVEHFSSWRTVASWPIERAIPDAAAAVAATALWRYRSAGLGMIAMAS